MKRKAAIAEIQPGLWLNPPDSTATMSTPTPSSPMRVRALTD